jgi:hypothetical protein
MRRTCTFCWTAFLLLVALAVLPACSPTDLVKSMQQKGQPGDDAAGADNSAGSETPAGEDAAEQDAGEQPNREVATVGVGKKGRLKGEGMLRSPIKQYFRAPQHIIFDIQIPHMIKQYKALDPQGKGPRSHEEFMKEIIEAAQIQLPELPEGDRYEYDPEEEQLYVVHPK